MGKSDRFRCMFRLGELVDGYDIAVRFMDHIDNTLVKAHSFEYAIRGLNERAVLGTPLGPVGPGRRGETAELLIGEKSELGRVPYTMMQDD